MEKRRNDDRFKNLDNNWMGRIYAYCTSYWFLGQSTGITRKFSIQHKFEGRAVGMPTKFLNVGLE